jgi:alkanesulfonate monooxygenase SsuD/methylene tetrahydromethanopterin reductase-like flavin-dependent oxidoreductase (luciferase family)
VVSQLQLFSYADGRGEGPAGPLYRDLLEQAAAADAAGYGRFWLTEQHLTAPGRVPDSLQLLAAVAARTERLGLGTAVASAALHSPVRLAESALQLQALSGHRLDLGIGSGSEAGRILDVLGVAPEDTAARTAELYAVLAQARPGELLRTVAGRVLEPPVGFDPPPEQPLLARVWTAAGRTALDLVRRHRTGLLLPRPMPLAARLALAEQYRDAVPEGRVVHFTAGFVAPTAAEARRRAMPFLTAYARRYLAVALPADPDSADVLDAIERMEFAVGSATEVAAALHRRLARFDPADSLAIELAGPGLEQRDVLEAIALLALHIAEFGEERPPAA